MQNMPHWGGEGGGGESGGMLPQAFAHSEIDLEPSEGI